MAEVHRYVLRRVDGGLPSRGGHAGGDRRFRDACGHDDAILQPSLVAQGELDGFLQQVGIVLLQPLIEKGTGHLYY